MGDSHAGWFISWKMPSRNGMKWYDDWGYPIFGNHLFYMAMSPKPPWTRTAPKVIAG